MPDRKFGGHSARLREKENLFRYRAQSEGNLLCFVRARAHVRALMTWKSCAVGIRSAILRNYLKGQKVRWSILKISKALKRSLKTKRNYILKDEMIFRSLLFLLIGEGPRIIDYLMLGNCFSQSTGDANCSQRFRTTVKS